MEGEQSVKILWMHESQQGVPSILFDCVALQGVALQNIDIEALNTKHKLFNKRHLLPPFDSFKSRDGGRCVTSSISSDGEDCSWAF